MAGLAALILLGVAVGSAGTALDDWFQRLGARYPQLGYLLVFTDGRVTLGLAAVLAVAALYRRRWRLAAVAVAAPVVAVWSARIAKRLFGRYKQDALAYPSGHTTVAVVVLGTAVLMAGVATWAVVAATVVAVLGVLGQGVTYHYVTDAVGAVFLGTALVCASAAILAAGKKLDGCQPECDVGHKRPLA